uniref:Zinc finger, CCHC-type n=1 Tax=Tanacetum cinerariifolium TaxID=118510 RepID=A0A6L2KL75_TANCI|nr:zinc finger, CCHC-type [Tanacetum cinerariifolium]
MQDASSIEELIAWAEEEVGSPYLRTPLLKPRRKGVELPCKNLFGEFLHCDSVADEFVLHDNWEYKGLSLDGYIDVGGLVHAVICTKLSLLLKKGRSRVNVTRKRKCQYKKKINMLRKGRGKRVSVGENNERLGSLITLNEHEGDDDPQVMTQVSLTVETVTPSPAAENIILRNIGVDENLIRTLGDYSKLIHEGYMNAIELPEGAKVSPLRSDTIRLVQNGCAFYGLMSEDLIQHLKDFFKIVDSIDLNGAT